MNQIETQTVKRTEAFECDGAAELDLRLGAGRIDIRATEAPGIRVEVSAQPGDAARWEAGRENLPGHASGGDSQPSDVGAHAVQETHIVYSEDRRRLVLRAPRSHRRAGLAVTVDVPKGSRLVARAAGASLTATGELAALDAATHRGDVSAEHVEGDVRVRTGSGDVRLGRVAGNLRATSGSGELEVASLDGDGAKLATGRGDVWLGLVRSDVHARSGNGAIEIAEAAAGRIDLGTGSGDVRVGVRAGVSAEIDIVSGSGEARSELDVTDRPAQGATLLYVRARTGSGDAVVTRASARQGESL